jgi:hypothetical protein
MVRRIKLCAFFVSANFFENEALEKMNIHKMWHNVHFYRHDIHLPGLV